MKRTSGFVAVIWSLIERLSSQVISFLLGIVLARLLSPSDYGIVGMTMIFILLSNVFIEAGFANALIRKTNRTEQDLSTAFYFNVLIGILAYCILWIGSPFIADWFKEPLLSLLIRISGVNVLLNSLCIVQTALLTANLDIRRQTIINLCGQIPAGLITAILAYNGLGVYALVFQTIIASCIRVIMLWLYTPWRPQEKFNRESFLSLWNFGSKLLGANLIGTTFNQVSSVLIGKYIGKSDLGYYSKASNLCGNIDSVSSGVVQKVALPMLSEFQKDKVLLSEKFREMMRLLIMGMAPLISFFCFTASDIIVILWTEKWIQCAFVFQILIVGAAFNPIGHMSLSLMQTVGNSALILKLEVPKKIIYCIYLAIGFCYGLVGLAVAQVLINITGALINMWATKRIVKYSYMRQIVDVLGYMVIAFIVGYIWFNMIHTGYMFFNILLMFMLIVFTYFAILVMIKDAILIKYVKKIIGL